MFRWHSISERLAVASLFSFLVFSSVNALSYEDSYHTHPYGEEPRGARQWDWDYKEGWRYHQKEFFSGKTQPEVYREEHPYGPGGIGYDADDAYLRLLERNPPRHVGRPFDRDRHLYQ